MRVFRICSKAHAAFDGEGARLYGGRWNRRGTAVVYASDSLALAALELLVHADADLLPDDLVSVAAEVPDGLRVESVAPSDLPRDWRRHPAPETLAERGTAWARAGRTAVLAVPSALVPRERNFLLNPAHPDFKKIRTQTPEPFALDTRLRAYG